MKLTLASKITIIRVALIPLIVLLMYLPGQVAAIAAIILFILASLSDFVDGYIARKYNQVSTFGMFLDPLADKFLVISVMLVLVERGIFPGWAAFAVIARELAVTSLRLFAVEKDRVIAAANSGKLKNGLHNAGACGHDASCPSSHMAYKRSLGNYSAAHPLFGLGVFL